MNTSTITGVASFSFVLKILRGVIWHMYLIPTKVLSFSLGASTGYTVAVSKTCGYRVVDSGLLIQRSIAVE
jgi:hypothetical protein